MSGLKIEGDASGNVAEVDTNNNLKVTGQRLLDNKLGYMGLAGVNDTQGIGQSIAVLASRKGKLQVGQDSPLFDFTFTPALHSTNFWRLVFVTMTTTCPGGFQLFNANSDVTTAHGVQFSTWRQFNLKNDGALVFDMDIALTASLPQTNEIFEIGMFQHNTGIVAPLDGVFFRITDAGLIGVCTFSGTETTTGVLALPATFTLNTVTDLRIVINEEVADFWRDGVLLGTVPTPAAQNQPFAFTTLPGSIQYRNGGAVSGTAMQVRVFDFAVAQRDLMQSKLWSHLMASAGSSIYQTLDSVAGGPSNNYTNALALGAGTALAAATAVVTGLGGQVGWLPTLAAGSDGQLCSFQNPVSTASVIGRTLIITGVRLTSLCAVALTGGPVIGPYTLAFGHTAISLATAETGSLVTATTKKPRFIPIGMESFLAAAALGTKGSELYLDLTHGPVAVNPGEFVAVAFKNFGTVTTLGQIVTLVTFIGYWE